MSSTPEHDCQDAVIPLYADTVSIARRKVEGDTIRVTVHTHTREQVIEQDRVQTHVEIERIPIGRMVDAAPPMRTEGDTIFIPVVEEIVVVERRLVLKEEIVLRRVRTTDRHRESVILREQEAVIERAKPDQETSATSSSIQESILIKKETPK